jgi:hypothetical protein
VQQGRAGVRGKIFACVVLPVNSHSVKSSVSQRKQNLAITIGVTDVRQRRSMVSECLRNFNLKMTSFQHPQRAMDLNSRAVLSGCKAVQAARGTCDVSLSHWTTVAPKWNRSHSAAHHLEGRSLCQVITAGNEENEQNSESSKSHAVWEVRSVHLRFPKFVVA